MREWLAALSFLTLAACGGGKSAADDSGERGADPTLDTGPCLGAITGSISVADAVNCAAGCSGDLLIGWFDVDPTANPATEPLEGYIASGVDLSSGPVGYTMDVVACGEGWLAALLDVNGDFSATPGDLVPLSGADQGIVRDDETSTIDQVLNFRLME